MKIQILLRHLTIAGNEKQKGHIKINIDDYLKLASCQQIPTDNVYNFMEKNIIEIDASLPNYITFDFVISSGVVARISLFLYEAMDKRQIILNPIQKSDTNLYSLNYEIKITEVRKNSEGVHQYVHVGAHTKKTSMKDDISSTIGERGNLKMIELGKLTYSFAKRLDPLVSVTNKAKALIFWQKPEVTFIFGAILSLMVLFPKISIILFSIFLIFGKGYIINQFQKTLFKQDISKRILPPEENFNFLKQSMEVYYDAFEAVYEFMKEDDRTKIITIVQIITKCGVVLLVLQLIFSLEALIVIGIWTVLFSTSSSGKRMRKALWPKIINMNTQVDNVIQNVTKSSVGRALNTNRSQTALILKEYYIFEYQRWWVGKQWVVSHYSDENRQNVLEGKKDPPFGWTWAGPWQVQKNANTDSQGFQYTNDLIQNVYSPSKSLKTIRRRKWVRVCRKINENQLIKSSSMFENTTYGGPSTLHFPINGNLLKTKPE